MDLTFEIQETVKLLDDNSKLLVLEIMKKFLPDDIATPEDLYYINVAEEEYANGESSSWSDILWKVGGIWDDSTIKCL